MTRMMFKLAISLFNQECLGCPGEQCRTDMGSGLHGR